MSAAKAIAYYRTSSATNVGADKDSPARQKSAVTAYAKANKITIVTEFYDAAVSGADPIEARPGFLDMLAASPAMACAASWWKPPTALPAI